MDRSAPWFECRGTGPPLALLPGGPGMASDYLERVADLVSDVFQAVLIDPPGCGRSSGMVASDVLGIVEAIDQVRVGLGLDEWTVGGHSFGADLALAYALERPRHTRAVLAISPSGVQDDRDWHRAYEAGREAGQDQVPESAFGLNLETHAAALTSWREYIKQRHVLRRLADLATPYLAIIGSDEVRPSWPIEQVAALVQRGEVVVIKGAGHCPWWTHPTELRLVVKRLI